MNKNKKKMSKKPKRKTKKPRYYKDKSVKQNVNVKNIISAGGGAGGGGSSSYPVPMPQYIQTPIPQAFQQTNTENMNMRSLIDEVKNAIRRPVYAPQPLPYIPDTVYAGTRDVSHQFDPVIRDIEPIQDDNYSDMTESIQPQMSIPFGSTSEASGNLSAFIQDIEQNPEFLEEEDSSAGGVKISPEQNPIINPKPEDPNKSLMAQVQEQNNPPEQKEDEKPVKKSRAKKEYGEPYTDSNTNRLLVRSNFTGKILDITDWPMWDKNTLIRLDPNNPGYHINTKSGVYGKGRKNVEKFTKPKTTPKVKSSKTKVNFVTEKAQQVPVLITEQSAV